MSRTEYSVWLSAVNASYGHGHHMQKLFPVESFLDYMRPISNKE